MKKLLSDSIFIGYVAEHLVLDHIPHGPTQDGVSLLYLFTSKNCAPATNFHQLSIMITKSNTAPNAIIFGHGVDRDVHRARRAILYAVLARRGSYCDRNAVHRKFRSKNLGGSFLSSWPQSVPMAPFGALLGAPNPFPTHKNQKEGAYACPNRPCPTGICCDNE